MSPFSTIEKCLDCKRCFYKNDLFSLLSDEELDILNESRVEVSFKKGEIIYKEGMPLTHLVIIHSGYGKIYIEGSKGKNLILSYSKAFELNGGIGIFLDHIHHSSLMAVNDCHTCFIDVKSFNKVLMNNNTFLEAYLKEYSRRVQQTYHQFAVLTQKNMEGRMAEAILYLQENISQNGSISNVSKVDLAELTAMSKESAIRVLKEFKDEGYIHIEDHKIHIQNDQALRQIAAHG